MIRLSHSAKDKINTCSAMYKYHYIDKLRPDHVSSALFYGKALDDAFSAILERKLDTPPAEIKDPGSVFRRVFSEVELNGQLIANTDIRCKYFKSDLDPDLCSEPDDALWLLSNYKGLDGENLEQYNRLCVESLTNKAMMMIDAYETEVFPQIEKVYSLQEEVMLPNDDGDTVVGFIDVVCSFIDEPGVPYIVDNKTSSKNYKEDSVCTSEQLATYCDFKLIDKAAYIVLNKKLRKKDPRVNVQIIRDVIPEEMFSKVFDSYGKALYTIREKNFTKNFESGCFFFGAPCPYYRYCRDGNTNGLVSTKKPEEGGF